MAGAEGVREKGEAVESREGWVVGGEVMWGGLGPLPQRSWEPRRTVGRAEMAPDLGAHRRPVVAAAERTDREEEGGSPGSGVQETCPGSST